MLVNVFRVSENVNALPLFSWFLNVITVRFFLLSIPTSDHSSYSFPFHLPPPHKKMSEMTSTVSTYIVHSIIMDHKRTETLSRHQNSPLIYL